MIVVFLHQNDNRILLALDGAATQCIVGGASRGNSCPVPAQSKVGNYLQSNYGISAYVNTKGNDYKLRHPEAKAMDCSVIVSIHFNASGGSGTESYVHSANSAAGSRALQHSTHTRLVSALGLRNRGELDEWFAVVSGPLPSVLLEICFIDNSNDMRTYQGKKEAVAQAIAQGIAEA